MTLIDLLTFAGVVGGFIDLRHQVQQFGARLTKLEDEVAHLRKDMERRTLRRTARPLPLVAPLDDFGGEEGTKR